MMLLSVDLTVTVIFRLAAFVITPTHRVHGEDLFGGDLFVWVARIFSPFYDENNHLKDECLGSLALLLSFVAVAFCLQHRFYPAGFNAPSPLYSAKTLMGLLLQVLIFTLGGCAMVYMAPVL